MLNLIEGMRKQSGAHKRWAAAVTAITIGVAVLAGCTVARSSAVGDVPLLIPQGTSPVTDPDPNSTANADARDGSDDAVYDATWIVGHWTVTAPGEWDQAVVQFGDKVTVWRKCGGISFNYFVGPNAELQADTLYNVIGKCSRKSNIPWLANAERLVRDGDSVKVLGADGSTLATWQRGGTPNIAPKLNVFDFADAPTLTPELADRLTWTKLELPETFIPATHTNLTRGRWVPADKPAEDYRRGSMNFWAHDRMGSSDGCNGTSMNYFLAPSGEIKVDDGYMSLALCFDYTPYEGIDGVRAIGVADDGQTLVFIGTDGQEFRRLALED